MIPKFRAWDKESQTMYEVKSIIYTLGSMLCVNRDALFPERTLYLEDTPVMQSTGKMDSTGKTEVYDGDILYYYDQDEDNYGVIKFDEDTLAFILDNGNECLVYGDYGMGQVVGNIYQNKDLVDYIYGNYPLGEFEDTPAKMFEV